MPDVGIIGMMPDTWGGIWQARHHVMTRLARYFHVAWIDPTRDWRAHWIPWKRGGASTWWAAGEGPAPAGMLVVRSSRWLPGLYRPQGIARWIRHQRVLRAVARLRSLGARRFVTYIWRPEFAYAAQALPSAISCYHLDDEYTFFSSMSDVELPVPAEEAALLRHVDQVFLHSPGLMEKKGHYNPRTMLVPNGVDYAAFSRPREEPDDLRGIAHPRVGYVGVIKDELDIPMLLQLAQRHSECSFVLVGPAGRFRRNAETLQDLLRLRNVFSLGRKQVTLLPAYMQHLDVCMLPYLENNYTRYIYPMKLHEYLATGRPVVAKPILSLQSYGRELRLARTDSEWSRALQDALDEPSGSGAAEDRRALARRHDWDLLVKSIADTIVERLEARSSGNGPPPPAV